MITPRLRSAAGLLTLAGLLAAGPAEAYVRTTDPDTGACLYWGSRSVTYRINPTRAGTSPSCGPLAASNAGAAQAVEAGFAQWSGVSEACTDLALERGPDTTEARVGYDQGGSNENLVVFRKGRCAVEVAADDPCWAGGGKACAAAYGCFEHGKFESGIIALTTTTYIASTGELLDADMEFVDWTGDGLALSLDSRSEGWYFTCFAPAVSDPTCATYGQDGCVLMDLQNTATHEAGHFIGLNHSCSGPTSGCIADASDTTMFATATIGEISKRSLADDDRSGLCSIYPKAAATSVCVAPKKSKGGCASADGVGLASLLALLALRRRSRREDQRTITPA
jgi:hypothetical protein